MVLTEYESEVLSGVNDVPGLTIRIIFDKNYYKYGKWFLVEEWDRKLPNYEPIRKRREYLGIISGYSDGGSTLDLTCFDEKSIGTFVRRVTERDLRHGYFKLIPVQIVKTEETSDG